MNNISLDKDIIDCWRVAARADFVRKAIIDKFKLMIGEINPIIRKSHNRFQFDIRNVTNGNSYVSNDEGTVKVYAILPTIYPGTDNGQTLGPFFVSVCDRRHDNNDEGRYCINLEKVKSSQHLAEIIIGCLLHPEDITPKYIRHDIIITEMQAKAKLTVQY